MLILTGCHRQLIGLSLLICLQVFSYIICFIYDILKYTYRVIIKMIQKESAAVNALRILPQKYRENGMEKVLIKIIIVQYGRLASHTKYIWHDTSVHTTRLTRVQAWFDQLRWQHCVSAVVTLASVVEEEEHQILSSLSCTENWYFKKKRSYTKQDRKFTNRVFNLKLCQFTSPKCEKCRQ